MATRFQRVATHVIGSRGAASTTATEHAPDSQTTCTPAAHEGPACPRLLSPTQLADFARTGYCMFTIPEDELPSSHHTDFYDMIYAHAHSEDGTGGQMPIAAVADVVDSTAVYEHHEQGVYGTHLASSGWSLCFARDGE